MEQNNKFKKFFRFSKIKTKEDTLRVMKSVSFGFIVIALIQFLLLITLLNIARTSITNKIIFAFILEYGAYIILAILFLKFKDKLSITILSIIATIKLITAVIRFSIYHDITLIRGLLIPLIAFLFGVVGVWASFRYDKLKKVTNDT